MIFLISRIFCLDFFKISGPLCTYYLEYFSILFILFQAFRVEDDDFIYADSDYRDLYAYGPVTYTQTSRNLAQTKKEEFAKRYGTIGR